MTYFLWKNVFDLQAPETTAPKFRGLMRKKTAAEADGISKVLWTSSLSIMSEDANHSKEELQPGDAGGRRCSTSLLSLFVRLSFTLPTTADRPANALPVPRTEPATPVR